tara:strand:- start:3692 stop:3853 length:162 start_codon:yes stop_codon:yes gene_type:complete
MMQRHSKPLSIVCFEPSVKVVDNAASGTDNEHNKNEGNQMSSHDEPLLAKLLF